MSEQSIPPETQDVMEKPNPYNYYFILTTGFGLGFLHKRDPIVLAAIAFLPFYAWLQYQNPIQGVCLILFLLIIIHRGISKFITQIDIGYSRSIIGNKMCGLLIASYSIPCSIFWYIATVAIYWIIYQAQPEPVRLLLKHTPKNSAFSLLNQDLITALYTWGILQALLFLLQSLSVIA